VKHSFLLDENILYRSIQGVDPNGEFDLASMHLVLLIAQNCHSIRYNSFLLTRYMHHLSILKNEKSKMLDPLFFHRLFFGNSLKAFMEHANAYEEARRGAYNPTYLYYTLGKLQILKLRWEESS